MADNNNNNNNNNFRQVAPRRGARHDAVRGRGAAPARARAGRGRAGQQANQAGPQGPVPGFGRGRGGNNAPPPNPQGPPPQPPQGAVAAVPAARQPGLLPEATETARDREVVAPPALRSIPQAAASWAPFCNQGSPLEKELIKIGIRPIYHRTLQQETAGHPVGAAAREMMTAQSLAEFYKVGLGRVVSLYGSPRDLRVADQLNKLGPGSNPIDLKLYRPKIVGSDITRVSNFSVANSVARFDDYEAFLMVDIYETEIGPFRPEFVAGLLQGDPRRRVIWVGHQFSGPAGILHMEGAWKRVNDKILCRPDRTSQAYPLHSPCDWLWERQAWVPSLGAGLPQGSLNWVTKTVVGDMRMIIFEWFATLPVVMSSAPPPPAFSVCSKGAYRYATGRAGDLLRWYDEHFVWSTGVDLLSERFRLQALEERQILVPLTLWRSLSDYCAGRTYNALTMKQVVAHVAAAMSADQGAALFWGLFPDERPTAAELTVSLITSETLDRRVGLRAFAHSYGAMTAEYNSALAQFGSAPPPAASTNRLGIIATVLFGLASIYLRYRLARGHRGTASLSDVIRQRWPYTENTGTLLYCLYVIFGAPVIEEAIKRIHPLAKWGLVFMEAFERLNQGVPVSVCAFIATNHHIWTMLPYRWGVVAHCLWNFSQVGSTLFIALVKMLWGKGFIELGVAQAMLEGLTQHNAKPIGPSVISAPAALGTSVSYLPSTPLRTGAVVAAGVTALFGLNYLAKVAVTSKSRWDDFRRMYYFEPWAFRPGCESGVASVTPFDPSLSSVPTQDAHTPIPTQCPLLKVKGEWPELEQDSVPRVPDTRIFWILPHNVPGYSPRRSDWNLKMTTLARVTAAAPMDPEIQYLAWAEAFGLKNWREWDPLRDGWEPTQHWNFDAYSTYSVWWLAHIRDSDVARLPCAEDYFAEWVTHLDASKVKRARLAYLDLQTHGMTLLAKHTHSIKLMVKTDEMLFRFADDGTPECKPRCIANVHPVVATHLGPIVYQVQKKLAACWHWGRAPIAVSVPVTPVTYLRESKNKDPILLWTDHTVMYYLQMVAGSAMTDAELSAWINSIFDGGCRRNELYIIVAGDDLLAIWFDKDGMPIIVEADQKMFDQSVSKGPLTCQYIGFKELGMQNEYLEILEACSSARYVAAMRNKTERVVITRDDRRFRDTGGVDTTSGNSFDMGVAAGEVFRRLIQRLHNEHPLGYSEHAEREIFSKENIIAEFARLGFAAKVRIHDFIEDATFLKGMWYPTSGMHPADSRLHGDGNPFRGYFWGPLPSRVLKTGKALRSPKELYPKMTFENACEQFLNDLADGYSFYYQVPLLRVFVRNFRKRSSERTLIERHKVQADKTFSKPLWSDAGLHQICLRYGTTPEEIRSFEEMYPDKPFCFFEHPLFLKLAMADYC